MARALARSGESIPATADIVIVGLDYSLTDHQLEEWRQRCSGGSSTLSISGLSGPEVSYVAADDRCHFVW